MTLLEALVVVAVLALVTALGFPVVRAQSAAADWRAAETQLVRAAGAARADALRGDDPVTLSIEADGRGFGTGDDVTAAPGGVRLSGPGLTFEPGGAASGGIGITDGKRRAALTADPETGRVRLVAEGA